MAIITREQFTAYDGDLHPECDNSEYLDYEKVKTGLSNDICKYGYKITEGTKYRWITKSEVESTPQF